ncbi:hypothetical protein BDV18DRAFT_144860 [Aspergillus unguis]
MVHRGRLSAACGPCRSRRLKCDHQKPFCGQCIRAKRECSGYRDIFAGRFYDQTEEVKNKNSSLVVSSSPKRRLFESDFTVPLVQEVSIPIADQGTAFVLSRYLSTDSLNEPPGPVGNYLPRVINTPPGRAATASVNAVGLAALSNIHQSSQLMLAARQEYVSALRETNEALSDQLLSTSNASLIAVTFLGMYELMTCDGPPLMEKYLNHLNGCSQLLHLRGSQQLKDVVGMALFTHFRMTIVLGNFWLKRPTPSWLVELSHEALSYRAEGDTMGDELFLLMAQAGDLCAGLRNNAVIEPAKVLKKTLKLDAELGAWAVSVDPERRYTTVRVPEPESDESIGSPSRLIHGSHYHIYSDTVVSTWWNDYRFVRLILLELICWLSDHLARKDEASGAEYRRTVANSIAISQQLTDDICASVPFHLGATATSPYEDWNSTRTGAVIRLIWPLFIAADTSGVTPQTVEWISATLFRIGHGMGIRQALVMAGLLREGKHLSWLPELG